MKAWLEVDGGEHGMALRMVRPGRDLADLLAELDTAVTL